MKEASYLVKEELITLIKLEERLKGELDNMISTYNKTAALEGESQGKVRSLEDELAAVESDLNILTEEYLKENDILKG
jgi:hypothetical protein